MSTLIQEIEAFHRELLLSTQKSYLDGILIANRWHHEAMMEQNHQMMGVYQRILDGAIEEYEKRYGKLEREAI